MLAVAGAAIDTDIGPMSIERVREDAIELAKDGVIVGDSEDGVLIVSFVVRKPEHSIADEGSASAAAALTAREKRRARREGVAAQSRVSGEVMIPEIQKRRSMQGVRPGARHDVDRTRPRQPGRGVEVERRDLKLLDGFL